MKTKITINDIAQEANVAKSTVSRYLNGGSVSKKTQEKLNTIIERTNYRPNTFAQGLKAKKTRIVGIVVPRLDSTAQVEMLRGIDFENTEYTFLIMNTYQDSEQELAAIKRLIEQNVQGLIILTPNMTTEIKETLLESKLPIVIQGQDEPQFHRIIMDDIDAGTKVGLYAQSLSPKHVLMLSVSKSIDWAVGHDRMLTLSNNLKDTQVTLIDSSFNMDAARQSALEAMSKDDFDLVIGATDRMTVGAVQAGIELGQTPQYIGFGKSDFSTTVTPNLTSFEFDFFETGKEIHHLFKKVADNPNIETQCVTMSGTLVKRASTK